MDTICRGSAAQTLGISIIQSEQVERRSISMSIAHINGTDLFYTEYGTGLPCLVMHGGLGLDHVHLRVLDALGDVLHLVYYDHRHNGRSGRPPLETVTHAQMADDAEALRQHLGL